MWAFLAVFFLLFCLEWNTNASRGLCFLTFLFLLTWFLDVNKHVLDNTCHSKFCCESARLVWPKKHNLNQIICLKVWLNAFILVSLSLKDTLNLIGFPLLCKACMVTCLVANVCSNPIMLWCVNCCAVPDLTSLPFRYKITAGWRSLLQI